MTGLVDFTTHNFLAVLLKTTVKSFKKKCYRKAEFVTYCTLVALVFGSKYAEGVKPTKSFKEFKFERA